MNRAGEVPSKNTSERRRTFRGRLTASILALGAAAPLSSVRAQAAEPLPLDSLRGGAHIRGALGPTGARFDAFVRAVGTETIVISSCKACRDSTLLQLSDTHGLEVARRTTGVSGDKVLGGMFAGTLLGAVAGGGIGAVAAYVDSRRPSCEDLCGLVWLIVPYGAIAGGVAGFVVGGIVGSTQRDTYWVAVRVPLPAR